MFSHCECCEFDAPNHSRYLKHLGTKKHAKRYLESIKHMENPNQNIVFSHSLLERVQEKKNEKTEENDEKGIQNEILDIVQEGGTNKKENKDRIAKIKTFLKKVQEKQNKRIRKRTQNKDVQETEEEPDLEEDVQEITDFVFLDTHSLELYKNLIAPLNPTFSWIMWLIVSITAFFHPFSKKTEEKDL